ncbi:MAG: helix-turn-helix domain-containing protein [Caldilineaceae bacterium]
MNIQPIRTEADYVAALKQIEDLMDTAQPASTEEDLLDLLATLVMAYEAKQTPIEPPDPISALEHYLDRQGLERQDLVPYIGTIGRVHEIMNRRRRLSLTMMRKLAPVTGIPISTLAQPYDLLSYQPRQLEKINSTQNEAQLEPIFT